MALDNNSKYPTLVAHYLPLGAGQHAIAAESHDERLLLKHSAEAGHIIILEAYYDITEDLLLLPKGAKEATVIRVCRAFEAAAQRHAEAHKRRKHFRLVKK